MFLLFDRENGKLWIPTNRSLICSDHFVGNKRSMDPQSPSYIPSIFPKAYKRPNFNSEQQTTRYNRFLNRMKLKNKEIMSVSISDTLHIDNNINNVNEQNILHTKCNVSTQVAFNFSAGNNFTFECTKFENNVNTQISVPMHFDNPFF